MSHFSPFDKKRYLIFVALKNNLFSSNSLSIFIINERQSTYVCVIHHNEIIISFILLRKAEKNKAKKKKEVEKITGKGNNISESAILFSLGHTLSLLFPVVYHSSCHDATGRNSAHKICVHKHVHG